MAPGPTAHSSQRSLSTPLGHPFLTELRSVLEPLIAALASLPLVVAALGRIKLNDCLGRRVREWVRRLGDPLHDLVLSVEHEPLGRSEGPDGAQVVEPLG